MGQQVSRVIVNRQRAFEVRCAPAAAADTDDADVGFPSRLDIIRRIAEHDDRVSGKAGLLQGGLKNVRGRLGMFGILGGCDDIYQLSRAGQL